MYSLPVLIQKVINLEAEVKTLKELVTPVKKNRVPNLPQYKQEGKEDLQKDV